MAYGVKYRLDFSDVDGNLKRLEILKDGYGGSVLPMVGTDEPVIIEWRADDDFYEPIIGSSCTINLMVTDSVTYDAFYEADEREYQVKVYYYSGGYQLYWQGYLTNEIYQEAIQTAPYPLSIKATDGLGTLNGFNAWMPPKAAGELTLWEAIYKNLQYLDLGFDIWISNDIRISTDADWSNVFEDCSVAKQAFFKKNYTIMNAKEVLRSVLLNFNCKIFQSYGRFYIINASSYNDQRIIDGVKNGTYSGAGILTAKQGFLAGGSEEIKFFIYNSSGANTGNNTANYLRKIKSDIVPINSNFVREVRRPLKKYILEQDLGQQKIDLVPNASFEFDDYGWVVTGGSTIVNDAFSGQYAFQHNSYVTLINTWATKIRSGFWQEAREGDTLQFSVALKITNLTAGVYVPYYIKINSAGNDYYYSDGGGGGWGFSATPIWNKIENIPDENWNEFKINTIAIPLGTIPNGYGQVEIAIAETFTPLTPPTTTIDNFTIRNTTYETTKYNSVQFTREQSTSFVTSDVLEHDNMYQGDIGDNTFYGTIIPYYALFRRCNDPNGKQLENIVTQQRINDFREYVKGFEGEFRLSTLTSMVNKIWIDFSNYEETDSAIIDSIKYRVKSNQATIRFHIPNNYTDVSSTFRVNFQE